MISAKIIADSISPAGHRLTTMQLRYPRFIHSEFMTHRVFSRNASSSRALPVAKLLEEVRTDALRAAPEYWGAEQKGMQAGGELSTKTLDDVKYHWHQAAMEAAWNAERLMGLGLHKSICNRLLEPFSHINVVVSSTEWGNFFGLRLHKDAEPTMRALAEAMWKVYAESHPMHFNAGEWHLPFMNFQVEASGGIHYALGGLPPIVDDRVSLDTAIKVSVARCARVSYQSFETGKRSTVEEDLKLYDRLLGAQPLHASPAEHQATPDEYYGSETNPVDITSSDLWSAKWEWGNFTGWRQYRKMLQGESLAPLPPGYVSTETR